VVAVGAARALHGVERAPSCREHLASLVDSARTSPAPRCMRIDQRAGPEDQLLVRGTASWFGAFGAFGDSAVWSGGVAMPAAIADEREPEQQRGR